MARRGSAEDPKVAALRESRCLNPHPGQVTDEAFLAEEFFDARDAVQVKYEMVRASAWTARRSPPQRQRSGTPGRRTTRQPPRWPPPGWTAWCRPSPGPRGGHKLTGQILSWAEQQLAGDPALRRPAWPGRSPTAFGVRVHPRSIERALARPAGALQKPLTCPPPSAGRRRTRPCPCDLHLAVRLLNQARHPRPGCRPGSCSRRRAGCPLRATASRRPARACDRVPARPRRAHRQGRHRLAARPGPPEPAHPPPALHEPQHWRPGRRGRCRAGSHRAHPRPGRARRRAGRHLITPQPPGKEHPCSPIPPPRR